MDMNDVRRLWRDQVAILVQSATPQGVQETQLGAHLLSLIMPDRLPRFLVPNMPLLPATKITVA